MYCPQVESELAQVTRERGDLSNQLSILARKKEGLNEELVRIRQRLEQANETNSRINRNLEDLVKDCEEKQVCTWTIVVLFKKCYFSYFVNFIIKIILSFMQVINFSL